MEQEKTNPLLVPAAIVVAGALIALAIYSGGAKPNVANNLNDSTPTIPVPEVSSKDHLLGNANAAVTIVEYSDTECPFCKTFHNTLKQIMTDYNGKVAWVYRHFPIVQLHSKAPKEAEALECAAELGGNAIFWKYLDQVFEKTNSNDSLDPLELNKIADSLSLDHQGFVTCLTSGRHTEKVQDSVGEAIKIGARGTPYSILIAKDGTQVVVNGAEPYASVKAKIDTLLK